MSTSIAMRSPIRPPGGTGGIRPGSMSGVRLTRRGRAAAAAAVVAVGAVLVLVLEQAPGLAGDETGPRGRYEYVVVEPGQTLWQVAKAAAPDVDPRVTVLRIQDLNGLPDASVAAGQRIAVPRDR